MDTAAKLQVSVLVSVGEDAGGKWDRVRQDSSHHPSFLSCTNLLPSFQPGKTLLALLGTHSWLPACDFTISSGIAAAPDYKS